MQSRHQVKAPHKRANRMPVALGLVALVGVPVLVVLILARPSLLVAVVGGIVVGITVALWPRIRRWRRNSAQLDLGPAGVSRTQSAIQRVMLQRAVHRATILGIVAFV